MASLLTLVLNVVVARAVSWQLVGQGCDYETFFPVLGGEKLMRPWYSPDSCLHHAAPAQQGLEGYTMRHKMPAHLLPKQPPPTSSSKVTSWLVPWQADQEPLMGKKWSQATGQLC